jgi:hypothetical protein
MKKFVLLISLFALASCSKSNNEISKNLESCDCVNMLDRYGLNTTEKADWNWDTGEIQKVEMKDDVPTGTIIINKQGEFLVEPFLCGFLLCRQQLDYKKQ